jgi:hypothetical protein
MPHPKPPFLLMALALLAMAGCTGSSVVGGPSPRDAASGDVTMDAPADVLVCPAPLNACNDRCTDPRMDRENCGVCGRACASSELCQNGACIPNCAAGERLCAGAAGDAGADAGAARCTSLQTDRMNCGACGTVCGTDQVCADGACTFMCTGTTTECSTPAPMDGGALRYCAELMTDRANCGACGNTCQEGYSCQAGRCRIRCSELLMPCATAGSDAGPMGGGEVCADTTNDIRHCGACGNECPFGQFCVRGACQTTCGSGFTNCSSVCRDLQTDRAGCGACGNACSSGEVCTAGRCVVSCGGGLSSCDGVCRDLTSDSNHCGVCGTRCMAGQVCSRGMCQVSCGAGLTECSGVCRDLRPTSPTAAPAG